MKLILENIEHNICTLMINRPDQYNALNYDVLKELDIKLDWITKKTEARAVILTGKGHKAFIAGADIQAMQKMNESQAKEFSKMGQMLTIKMEKYNIPIIAAVNGFALGGGCEFAMACHIRYASENAVFGQPEVSLGLIAGWGGTQRLPRLVGKVRALELLLTGNNLTAEKAESIGLVNKVVPLEELIPTVEKLASSIIRNSSMAVSATIKAVNQVESDSINNGLHREMTEFSRLFNSEDTQEGLSAFVEKRTPNYTGN